ncbi:MAG: hypothetical protein DWQ49_02070 [Bacteroidetes bacterium]|nr:MAG: hypothetical protein DWQ49_02070 [Bacteroidota bacterium]
MALTLDGATGNITGLEVLGPQLPSGAILQVKQTVKTDVGSFTSSNTNTFADIPGMSVSITPSSTSSKILVMFTANCSQSTTATLHIRLQRGSTSIFQGDADSNRFGSTQIDRTASSPYTLQLNSLTGAFLDSPSTTSATTYKLTGTLGSTYNGTFYINRPSDDSNDTDYTGRTASSIVVMEVAG